MGGTFASLAYLGILVVAVGAYFFRNVRLGLGQTLQMLLVWGMIFLGAMAAYGLWGDISRDFGGRQAVMTGTSITVPRSADGHYYLTVDINDTPIEFLVDTGASDLVLTREDAARVGLDVDGLVFAGQAQTANGTVPIARTRLDTVRVGDFEDRRVMASVNGGPMMGSLLGMSYLGRYDRVEITGNALILHR